MDYIMNYSDNYSPQVGLQRTTVQNLDLLGGKYSVEYREI